MTHRIGSPTEGHDAANSRPCEVTSTRSHNGVAGFTLVEILVALALLGMMLPALYGILTATVRLRINIQESGNPYGIGPRIIDLIEEDLRGIYFTNLKDQAFFIGESLTVSGQDADRIDFVTTVDSRVLLNDDEDDGGNQGDGGFGGDEEQEEVTVWRITVFVHYPGRGGSIAHISATTYVDSAEIEDEELF